MACSALDTAKRILYLGAKKGFGLDQLQLQKILFFAHGTYLALHDESLISDPVEVWKYGPVYREVYDEYKYSGRDKLKVPQSISCSEEDTFLNKIIDTYAPYSGGSLVTLSHQEGSPWSRAKKEDKYYVPEEYIRDWFKNVLKGSESVFV